MGIKKKCIFVMELDLPKEYANVAKDQGPEYYDYLDYEIKDGAIVNHDFNLCNYRGRGTFSRCFDSYRSSDKDRMLYYVIKVIRRSKETQLAKFLREISVLDKVVGVQV